jgi:hypothetical protein
MINSERLAYLNGLIKGMQLSAETDEGKLFIAITAALNEMAEILEGYDEALDALTETLSDVEESVYELEDEVYGDKPEFSEYDDLDDEIYDITCANCDRTITVDYDALDSGSVSCPGCGELIEFTIEED